MFYLFDDAFRIGEYIVAGSYKGTVESFSLRSVRLRHHRGPIYTIPFGDLGAVQNLSRDFVIDKLSFQVTYDTDLDKARKLIKKAGQELAADPEIGPKIIEPLKMQRVENFGEYGVEIKTKVTCVPGGQWEVRKKLYPMIKQLFEENGIEFARPTVKVSGSGTDNETVAARTVAAKKARAAKAAG
jgi:small-conductance mechanosensitive channel